MPSKKAIVGLLGIFLAVSVVALIPVFVYGFTVNVTEIEMSIGLSSSGELSTSSFQPTPSYDLSSFAVEANPKAISAYEYAFSKLDGNVDVVEEGNEGTEVVDILITFELTTPSNNSLSFSFSPQGLSGQGLKTILVLMGPDELNGEVGTFYLTITISITVSLPPPVNTEIVNLELTPVDLTFEIPA
ncbi:MAG: hypothetical protein HWN80_12675 [Candidatus Lokiarchaeota archaeon]|nr:hypothetical protein [Candidatus Lokiarchaeota archaeon]